MSITAEQVKELRELTGAGMMDCRKALAATNGDIKAAIEKLRMEGQAKAVKKAGRTAADGTIAVAVGSDALAIVELNCETDFVAKGADFQGFAAAAAKAALETRPSSIEQLASAKAGAQTLEEIRKTMVAKIGENITLRRFEVVKGAGGVLAQYIHAGSRIGVVVALSKGDAELGKDIAMHVAAQRPQYLKADEVPAEAQDSERKVIEAQIADQAKGKPPEIVKKMVDGKLRKFLGEITLLGQGFVKDPDQTVEQVLAARGGQVASFVRFEVGEGIEKQGGDFAADVAAMIKPH
ncbi:MAG TPA: translation elongation factor Ts [Verrucomicrobiae bacterium]|nr:translation elongation factor Ts [Verrucomicrobiae bacterium]